MTNAVKEIADTIMLMDLPARLTEENGKLRAVITALLAEPHGCVFCDSGKLRNPKKDHDEKCGFAMAARLNLPELQSDAAR